MRVIAHKYTHLRNANPELFITVNNNALEWLVEDICHPRAHICEEANWIPNEICWSQNSIKLTEYILSIMISDSTLQLRHRQSHVLDCKCIHLKRSIIYVSDCHRQSIDDDGKGVTDAEPIRLIVKRSQSKAAKAVLTSLRCSPFLFSWRIATILWAGVQALQNTALDQLHPC